MPHPKHSTPKSFLLRQGIINFSISTFFAIVRKESEMFIIFEEKYYMSKYVVGDQVSVLDEDFQGSIIAINKNEISIETTDGFVMKYHEKELIKINNTSELDNGSNKANVSFAKAQKDILKPKKTVLDAKNKFERGVPEFDLHIEKLVQNHRGMSNFDILNLQADTAKRHIEFAIRNRIPKIVFIHGVGEGILKAELDFMLKRYENISFQDANYQKYGQGATEIYFKQNVKRV